MVICDRCSTHKHFCSSTTRRPPPRAASSSSAETKAHLDVPDLRETQARSRVAPCGTARHTDVHRADFSGVRWRREVVHPRRRNQYYTAVEVRRKRARHPSYFIPKLREVASSPSREARTAFLARTIKDRHTGRRFFSSPSACNVAMQRKQDARRGFRTAALREMYG